MSEAVPEEYDEPAEPDPADGPDEDEEEETADTDEPEAESPSDVVMEKLYQSIERKAGNYNRGQAELLRDTGLEWQPCPCCAVAGFVLPYAAESPDDQLRKLNVDTYFHATEPEYRQANDREACPMCDGWGQVLSGSRADQHRVVPCSRCNGTGYVVKVDEQIVWGQPAAQQPPTPSLSALQNGPEQGPDVFGRPAGHKDYGVPPAYVNA